MAASANPTQLHKTGDSRKRAPRNRTLTANASEIAQLRARLLSPDALHADNFLGRTICGDSFDVFPKLPAQIVDVLILDPPYNLNKKFGAKTFSRIPVDQYTDWLRSLFSSTMRLLKPTATIYICGDWLSSASIFTAASEFFEIRNRITWEREKGRGALTNWKNASEDIWFCTVSDNYVFNIDAVKLRRRVIAPYRHADGGPKDWQETKDGNFRDTHPSNLWTDITIPFWSMPENTDHPTQKSEKSMAKIILASSNPNDLIFDPFLGSGTSSVVAKKLGRQFCGIELDESFAMLAEKRLLLADTENSIQGYHGRVFWERNTLNVVNGSKIRSETELSLLPFDE
ncbi:MAG TPA: site-specific DNA-methyltransferase [Terracidiphilus sp.]|jgi:site-specific DNA-methyltransferase (adenine-specific)|nr:site-specific DNA-methyltransferase [Terracidiphilus sp.]